MEFRRRVTEKNQLSFIDDVFLNNFSIIIMLILILQIISIYFAITNNQSNFIQQFKVKIEPID